MKILIINGPNLNLLGKRDSLHYGNLTLEDIIISVEENFPDEEFTFIQSNIEGEIVNIIQQADKLYEGLIINPGGYAHTSVAIRDALAECNLHKVEVHLSHLVKREDFRQTLITASGCDGYLSGFKEKGYLAAIYLIKNM
jgi:3-dehydroquinate dehydratase II